MIPLVGSGCELRRKVPNLTFLIMERRLSLNAHLMVLLRDISNSVHLLYIINNKMREN